MSDNATVVATPYPTYMTGGDDDDSFRAALTSHAGASVERNQDAQFSAVRSQFVHRDVVAGAKDGQLEALRNRYELTAQIKDAEIRALERHAEMNEKLARLEEKATSREISQLRAEAQGSVNAQILKLLEKLAASP